MQLRLPATNSRGFSLIELLIAMLLIAVTMLALLTSIMTVMRTNLQNEVRDTAVRLTHQTAEAVLSLQTSPVLDADLGAALGQWYPMPPSTITQQEMQKGFPNPVVPIRGTMQPYTVQWYVTQSTANVYQVNIKVSYSFGAANFQNSAVVYAGAKF